MIDTRSGQEMAEAQESGDIQTFLEYIHDDASYRLCGPVLTPSCTKCGNSFDIRARLQFAKDMSVIWEFMGDVERPAVCPKCESHEA